MKFTKLPVTVDAIRFTGNGAAVVAWMKELAGLANFQFNGDGSLTIPTLEGDHRADVGDWIIRGVKGEFYPCKPDIFVKTYQTEEHARLILLDFVLDTFGREVGEINEANGWNRVTRAAWESSEHHIPTVLALIHSEVSEALEGFRRDDIANFTEELADVVIRVLDVTDALGINLATAIVGKLAKNRQRGHHHGGKRV